MKKLTLSVDALQVESFDTSRTLRRHGGTVRGHGFTNDFDFYTCGWMQSCAIVCESDDCPTRSGDTCAAC
jgi:hypothetical protein